MVIIATDDHNFVLIWKTSEDMPWQCILSNNPKPNFTNINHYITDQTKQKTTPNLTYTTTKPNPNHTKPHQPNYNITH